MSYRSSRVSRQSQARTARRSSSGGRGAAGASATSLGSAAFASSPTASSRSNPSYVYGSAAPAESEVDAGEQRGWPRFGFIVGAGTNPSVTELPQLAYSVMRTIIVVVTVLFVIGLVRVSFTAMSTAIAMNTSELSSQIETARDEGNDLEVMSSQLATSARIKLEATSLGMAAPETTTVISLEPDIVVTDEEGNLSLSGSIEAIENAG